MPSISETVEPIARGGRAVEAWFVGVTASVSTLLVSGLGEAVLLDLPWAAWGALVFLVVTAAAATLTSTPKVTALEVGGLLLWAQMPLVGVQALAWFVRPGPPSPHAKLCSCVAEHGFLHEQDWLFALAECTALGCLAIGAYGLGTRRRSARTRLVAACLITAGAFVGHALGEWGLGALGAFAAMAAVVFGLSAKDVRSAQPFAAKSARVFACLAMALACATLASQVAFHPLRPLFVSHVLDVAQSIVVTYRALVVALSGCTALLVYALLSGRSSAPTPSSGVVLMAAAILFVGGAVRMQHVRLETFDDHWTHLEKHVLHRLEANRRLLPRGATQVTDAVGWPLRAEVHGYDEPFPRLTRNDVRLAPKCGPFDASPGQPRWLTVRDRQTFGEVADLVDAGNTRVQFPVEECTSWP